jgi:hypothetical protein
LTNTAMRSPLPSKASKGLWTKNPKTFTANELGEVSSVFYDLVSD